MSSGWQKERKNHLSPLPTCCQTREGKEKRNKCAHVDYRYCMSKIVLYKNWIRKQSTEIVLKVCILLHKNTTMHFISKQILHVHVIASNCSFTSFLTLKLRVYIHMSRWMGAKEISWKVSHDAVLMFCCFDQAYTKWGYSCNPHTRSWGMPLVQPASSVVQTEKKK